MFQPIESSPAIYKRVVEQIQARIASGELKKGDRLPPERLLAEQLNVGRPAVKQAISALEVLGIVRSRQGDGNYITSNTVDVISPLAMRFYLDNGNLDDILEFRYILEVQMASLAAAKITPEQAEEFTAFMDEMKQAGEDGWPLEKRKRYNNEFHYRIVSLCGNRLIQSIYSSILDLIAEQIKWTDGEDFYDSHRKIYDAICDHRPADAAFYMSIHFQNKFPNYRYYLDLHRPPEQNGG